MDSNSMYVPPRDALQSIQEGRNPQLENLLNQLGVPFTYTANYRLDQTTNNPASQIRFAVHQARPENVNKMTLALRAGVKLPALLLNDQGEVLDGNTRRKAYQNVGRQTVPVYLLIGDVSPELVGMIQHNLNNVGPQALTLAERTASLDRLCLNGHSDDQISIATNEKLARVKESRKLVNTNTRAGALGVDVTNMGRGARIFLGTIQLDQPFLKAIELTLKHGLLGPAVKDLVAGVKASGSEEAALRYINDRDVDFTSKAFNVTSAGPIVPESGTDVSESATGLSAVPSSEAPVYRRIVSWTTELLNTQPDDWFNPNEATRSSSLEKLKAAQDRLAEIISLYPIGETV